MTEIATLKNEPTVIVIYVFIYSVRNLQTHDSLGFPPSKITMDVRPDERRGGYNIFQPNLQRFP